MLKIGDFFCTHVVDFRRPGHIYIFIIHGSLVYISLVTSPSDAMAFILQIFDLSTNQS